MIKQIEPFSSIDNLLTSDEWDYVSDSIEGELAYLDAIDETQEAPPFFLYFESQIKDKLIQAGFKKDVIENQDWMKKIHEGMDMQGRSITGTRGVWNVPQGYPAEAIIFGGDKKVYWIKKDIEAALRALESISTLKGLLMNSLFLNKEATRVYLRSLELIVNLVRAGNVPKLAISEAEKINKSSKTRELKKEVMRSIIEKIFEKNPHRPKTLGEVWNKIDRGFEGIRNRRTKKEYIAKTGKDSRGRDVVIICGDVPEPFEYAKRSLQHFIDELK